MSRTHTHTHNNKCVSLLRWITPSAFNSPSVANLWLRKGFHILSVALFIPPLTSCKSNLDMIIVAMVLALLFFIFVERIRLGGFVCPGLSDLFFVFVNANDCKGVVVSHIYLLAGCLAPALLEYFAPSAQTSHVRAIIGVVVLGIGDAAAAMIGATWGTAVWCVGRKKTILGSVGFVVSTIAFAVLTGICSDAKCVFAFCTTMVLSALVEAFTNDCDNLALPLFASVCFRVIDDAISDCTFDICLPDI
eukprot:GHVR01005502.1.p1 GENE.GHVR01005502.1~~GHVR01005502.1.p1  ORF type:complete len:248 (+),score=43.44 GHVR01005502.1:190-933(+)